MQFRDLCLHISFVIMKAQFRENSGLLKIKFDSINNLAPLSFCNTSYFDIFEKPNECVQRSTIFAGLMVFIAFNSVTSLTGHSVVLS